MCPRRLPSLDGHARFAVDSITMSDQNNPVEIFTEATWEIEILSSVLPTKCFFTRLTRNGLTKIRVGNKRFPFVHRLAVKVCSEAASGAGKFWPEEVRPIRARP